VGVRITKSPNVSGARKETRARQIDLIWRVPPAKICMAIDVQIGGYARPERNEG
jgi:hypothetical protein